MEHESFADRGDGGADERAASSTSRSTARSARTSTRSTWTRPSRSTGQRRLAADRLPDAGRRSRSGRRRTCRRSPGTGCRSFPQVLRGRRRCVARASREERRGAGRGAHRAPARVRRGHEPSREPLDRGAADRRRSSDARRVVRPGVGRLGRRAEVPAGVGARVPAARGAPRDAVRRRSTRWRRAGCTTSSAAASTATRSTERWLVPHFEKMLYDNAQLASPTCTAGR